MAVNTNDNGGLLCRIRPKFCLVAILSFPLLHLFATMFVFFLCSFSSLFSFFLFQRVSTPVSQRHLQAWHAHCSVLLCMVSRWQTRSLIKRRVSENPFQNNKKQIVFISRGRVFCQRAPG